MFQAKSKTLAQHFARTMHHISVERKWDNISSARQNWNQANGQEARFEAMLKELADKVLGKKCYEYQLEAMEEGLTYPSSMSHSEGIE